ncbi:class I SAM-dependent DNA methyltransferase [Mycolicibacterium sarraceniae]|uniref:SAM-dependent methyltransferase n=1 Tax=Mycolicibacterium sarraceniae TaxID=1534348 RepID=A0A7I7SYH8_9MYCO|nr:class I SAM-dependent methyltransferase [Mycolicibacterium sarraceniae]BBY60876.1 SAM-dependent methyltransferase [Mycolicibacterium sarraceniae]
MSSRWRTSSAPRGDEYDARWKSLAAAGHNIHGEADLVESILRESGGTSVLDAGCGTGRVAIELANRGYSVAGVDSDAGMLAAARAKAPQLRWIEADLAADLTSAGIDRVNLVLLAGNVMIFLEPGTEAQVLAGLTGRLRPGGLLVAGFSIRPDGLSLKRYDEAAEEAGLLPVVRWATWDRKPFRGGDYAVSVHRSRRSPR